MYCDVLLPCRRRVASGALCAGAAQSEVHPLRLEATELPQGVPLPSLTHAFQNCLVVYCVFVLGVAVQFPDRVKLIDFGSVCFPGKALPQCATPGYVAPELAQLPKYVVGIMIAVLMLMWQ